ncbi:MAG: GSCFA domain-containing protein [Spirochaetales bacterium]|nr:GSCFA domain-containing protein [Spirochaetales bacterium]
MDSEPVRRGTSRAQEEFYSRGFSRVVIKETVHRIVPEDLLYFGGSCFAENLYSYWQDHYLPSVLSPFGSTYNPLSLRDCFSLLTEEYVIQNNELIQSGALWQHSLFNSTRGRENKEDLLAILNGELVRHRELLKESSCLVLTLGTAYVYEDIAAEKIVNNCHKRPAADFKRTILSPDAVSRALTDLAEKVRNVNSGIKMIISLSPVRHLRDDAAENSLSKAVLRCGIEEFLQKDDNSSYFPSYEILLDELRDYRWYADDLAHPSQQAVRYIMERFCESTGHERLINYLEDAASLKNMMTHRLRFPHSPEGRRFMEKRQNRMAAFQRKYPMAVIQESPES